MPEGGASFETRQLALKSRRGRHLEGTLLSARLKTYRKRHAWVPVADLRLLSRKNLICHHPIPNRTL